MLEVRSREIIQPKRATLADLAISWMCDHWQKNKPDHFSDRENEIVDDKDAKKRTVLERELEVVEEVVGLYENAKENGDLVAKEKNPLGEEVKELTMLFLSDTHLPGGNLEEEVYEKNNPYILLKKIRAVLEGVKRHRENRAARGTDFQELKLDASEALRLWKTPDELTQIRDEIREQDGIDSYNAFLALKNAFMRALASNKEFNGDAKVLLAHVGDNISNEQKMGDVAFSAAQLEEIRQEIADFTNQKTVLTKAQGNHDTDLINYGLEHDAFDRQSFGSQVFLQEVGTDVVVLSLNTNLYSSFWHKHLERRKAALHQRMEKVKSMIGFSEEKSKLEEMNERELTTLATIRSEMERQQRLVDEAVNSGKRIILVGHEKGYLERALGGNLDKTNVVAVVSGHTHKHVNEEKINKNGETVHYLNTGANQKVKTTDGDKGVLSGFSLKIKDSDEQGLNITIEEVIPTEADYAQGVFSMTEL